MTKKYKQQKSKILEKEATKLLKKAEIGNIYKKLSDQSKKNFKIKF